MAENTTTTAPLDMPPPSVDVMEFYMQRARTHFSDRVSSAPAQEPESSPATFNFDERLKLERAIAKSEKLIADMHAQLDRPILAPFELITAEQAEEANAKVKQYSESLFKMLHSHKLNRTQDIYMEVMATIEEIESRQLTRPRSPPSRIPRPANLNAPAPECQVRPSRIPRLSG